MMGIKRGKHKKTVKEQCKDGVAMTRNIAFVIARERVVSKYRKNNKDNKNDGNNKNNENNEDNKGVLDV